MFTLVYPDLTQKETTLTEVLKKDSYTLLYFYPKDDTPGCTIEAQEFTKYISSFQQLDIQVV
ncbi:MAG: redoxin domain-containing protein [bacterium]|nr:redoxin domain-containing protein [bacterium]